LHSLKIKGDAIELCKTGTPNEVSDVRQRASMAHYEAGWSSVNTG